MSLIFIFLSIALGFSFVRLFQIRLSRLEALAMSVSTGLPLSSWILFLTSKIFGFSLGIPVGVGIMICVILSIFFVKSKATFEAKNESKRYLIFSGAIAIVIAIIVLRLFVLSYQFPASDGSWKSNSNVWADGPLHVTYVTHFSKGEVMDMSSPNYMKVTLTYPFLADFYSAILKRLGGGWTFVMLAPSIIMILALLYLIYSFGLRLLGTRSAAWMQLLFLIFSGGGTQYLNFLDSHLLPQRSYLFGMALFVAVAIVLLETYRNRSRDNSSFFENGALPTAVLIGMMPLIHDHSFLVLVGILCLATLGMLWYWKTVPKSWITVLVVGGVLAIPQFVWQMYNTYNSNFTRWILGWSADPSVQTNFFVFWAKETGLLFFAMLVGFYFLKKYKASAPIWLLYVSSVSIFIICNVYVFQPSVWDNMKFFEYAFWFQMIVIGYILAQWIEIYRLRFLVPIIFLFLTIPGFKTLAITGPTKTHELLTRTDVSFGEDMKNVLPGDAFILISDRHNHPITMLSGRKVLMTYAGWFNLYDDRWQEVWKDRTSMLLGEEGAKELFLKYGVTHAVFSDEEVGDKSANLTFFNQNFKLLWNENGWWVFEI